MFSKLYFSFRTVFFKSVFFEEQIFQNAIILHIVANLSNQILHKADLGHRRRDGMGWDKPSGTGVTTRHDLLQLGGALPILPRIL